MLADLLERANLIKLTTTGRKSGRPHIVELWFAYQPDQNIIYLLAHQGASQQGTDWYRNALANPTVIISARGQDITAHLEPVADSKVEALEQHIRALFDDKYGRATVSYWYGKEPRLPMTLRVET